MMSPWVAFSAAIMGAHSSPGLERTKRVVKIVSFL